MAPLNNRNFRRRTQSPDHMYTQPQPHQSLPYKRKFRRTQSPDMHTRTQSPDHMHPRPHRMYNQPQPRQSPDMHPQSPHMYTQPQPQSPPYKRNFRRTQTPNMHQPYKRNFTRTQSPDMHRRPRHPQSPHMYPQSDYYQSPSHVRPPQPQFAYSQPVHPQYPLMRAQYDYYQSPSHHMRPQPRFAYSQPPVHPQTAKYPQFPIHPLPQYPRRTQSNYNQHPRNRNHELAKPNLRNLGASISKQTEFSLSLAKHVISAKAVDANFVFSPLSFHVVLSMVAAGAGGPTRDQLLGFLKSKSVEELNSLSSQVVELLLADGGPLGGPRLSFADGLWVDQSLNLKPAFKEIVENDYKAASNQVDFKNKADGVRKEVNAWAEKETNGLIKDLLSPGSVNSDTKLILANALYFKGAWSEKFEASLTKDGNFFLSNGNPVRVPFMTSWKKQRVRTFDGFKVLSLPYKQGDDNRRFSMCFYLPDARDGLPALVEKFGSIPGFIEHHLPDEPVELEQFLVPKFKIEFGFDASEIFIGQGLVLPFLPGGLTEMVESSPEVPSLMISKFFHKASIEVDEEGTEAAAASACLMVSGCAPPNLQKKLDFVADHPFLFVIREDVSGGVLFVGQLVNPLKK